MKSESPHRPAASNVRDGASGLPLDALARGESLIGSAAFGAATLMGPVLAATDGKKTFTILHTTNRRGDFCVRRLCRNCRFIDK
jgi:hypothetical protein